MTEAFNIGPYLGIATTIIGILITYFVANQRFVKYLTVTKEAMDIVSTALNENKSDAEVGKETREFFNSVHENTNLPLLTYK